jgi:hypothetical protein
MAVLIWAVISVLSILADKPVISAVALIASTIFVIMGLKFARSEAIYGLRRNEKG